MSKAKMFLKNKKERIDDYFLNKHIVVSYKNALTALKIQEKKHGTEIERIFDEIENLGCFSEKENTVVIWFNEFEEVKSRFLGGKEGELLPKNVVHNSPQTSKRKKKKVLR